MTETQRFADRDVVARRYRYADGDVLAFDLGAGVTGSVDVVDGTLMIVVDDEQHEFKLPGGRARATINNGVVTVEMDEAADTAGITDDVDETGGTTDTGTEDDR